VELKKIQPGYYRVNCRIKDRDNSSALWIFAYLDENGKLLFRAGNREQLNFFKCLWDWPGDSGYSCGEILNIQGQITFVWRDPKGEGREEVGYGSTLSNSPIRKGADFDLINSETEKYHFEVIEMVKLD
jgi:hypothetical protein